MKNVNCICFSNRKKDTNSPVNVKKLESSQKDLLNITLDSNDSIEVLEIEKGAHISSPKRKYTVPIKNVCTSSMSCQFTNELTTLESGQMYISFLYYYYIHRIDF